MKLARDLREFIELLNRHDVEYLLIGGWAFAFHATPRYTGDIDFLVKCNHENAERLEKVLCDFGFGSLPGFKESFLKGDRITQFGLPPNRIDILTKIDGVSFSEAVLDCIWGELDGLRLPVMSRAALIRNKLAAGRPKDIADVEALKRTEPSA